MTSTLAVGLEQGAGGATRAHVLGLPGCSALGATPEDALAALPAQVNAWLRLLAAAGEAVPPRDAELELAVDEWISTDADVAAAAGDVCFAADREPLAQAEIAALLRRLGDVRGTLLARIREHGDAALDRAHVGEWSARRVVEELARAQWWTLSRLGATPLADPTERTDGRLDTALALVVQQFGHLSPERSGRRLVLDGEEWTPRKVLRRLLWLEWELGRAATHALDQLGTP